eukprot:SAG31_NODE_4451_length_3220_cov_5.866709_2_plen_77_part_00
MHPCERALEVKTHITMSKLQSEHEYDLCSPCVRVPAEDLRRARPVVRAAASSDNGDPPAGKHGISLNNAEHAHDAT